MGMRLSEPEIQSDPRNHCVKAFEYFPSTERSYFLLVMPYLLAFDKPDFVFVDEVIDFMNQTLEVFTLVARIHSSSKARSGLDILT